MLEKYQILISSTILGLFILSSAMIIYEKPTDFESCQEEYRSASATMYFCTYSGLIKALKGQD
jgi:hypothetical protein